MIDVLHHTDNARQLLAEARRVARRAIVIKDHTLEGFGAGATLRWMDRVGNRRHGVDLPFNYWRRDEWNRAFRDLNLDVESWNARLGIYPWFARPLLERSLHFLSVCRPK
jgi:hypothetical protein